MTCGENLVSVQKWDKNAKRLFIVYDDPRKLLWKAEFKAN